MWNPRSPRGVVLSASVLAASVLVLVSGLAFGVSPPRGAPTAPTAPAIGHAGRHTSPATLPLLLVLAELNDTVGAWYQNFSLGFAVPPEVSTVLYVWSIGGGLAAYQAPTLPVGISVRASLASMSAGVAAGSLAPGLYASNLYYAGWTNTVSIVVYGVVHGTGFSYQYGSTEQLNAHPLNSTIGANLTLPSGGAVYVGAENTGGYSILAWSLTTVDEKARAWDMSGFTEVIGQQSSALLSGSTRAAGLGLVGVGIYGNVSNVSGPAVVPLATFSEQVGAWSMSFPLDFVVPSGVSQLFYVWDIGGGLAAYQAPTLPSGLGVVTSLPSLSAGIASGVLAPGTYSTDLYYSGWTNVVSIAVYGYYGPPEPTCRFASLFEPNPHPLNMTLGANLTLPAGGLVYLGAENTGGLTITNWSMPVTDLAPPAWGMPGQSEIIGRQYTGTFTGETLGAGLGLVAVGIYVGVANVTFRETGLPPGSAWTLVVDGSVVTVASASVTLTVPRGTVSYLVAGPAGYRVVGASPVGSLPVNGTSLVEAFSFVRGSTADFSVREKGLASPWPWCFSLGPWESCTTSTRLTFLDLTPGVYPYSMETLPGFLSSARSAGVPLAATGTIHVAHARSVVVDYTEWSRVTFSETGLANGTWSITIHRVAYTMSAGSELRLNLPNGVYGYKIGREAGFISQGSPRPLILRGAPVTVTVNFVRRV